MRRTFVKICGLQTPSDMEALQGVDLDAAGFILVPGRRRAVPVDHLRLLLGMLPPGTMAAGVMMNPKREDVKKWLRAGLDAVQLHGEESPAFCRWMKDRFSVPIIKAFSPDEAMEEGIVEAYAPWIDIVLLDSASGGRKGGTGTRFPWERIPEVEEMWFRAGRPVWVAGGLNPENVGDLLRRFAPAGVDVSSGVETEGCKDRSKVRAFVERVRAHDYRQVCKTN